MSDGTQHGFLFPPLRGGWQRLQALPEGVRRFPPGAALDPLRLLRRHLPLVWTGEMGNTREVVLFLVELEWRPPVLVHSGIML
jgi:hypothetical protein